MARLKVFYKKNVVPELRKELGIKNIMAIPKIEKITLNMGVGKAVKDKKFIDFAFKDLEAIAGQKPIITKTKKSIAGFKIREGWPIGVKVTLRQNRMFEFLDRLISIAIPRIRDFRGLSVDSFDGYGNYNMGVREHISFPEIDYEKVNEILGIDISITTTAKNDTEGISLLRLFNFPLKV